MNLMITKIILIKRNPLNASNRIKIIKNNTGTKINITQNKDINQLIKRIIYIGPFPQFKAYALLIIQLIN